MAGHGLLFYVNGRRVQIADPDPTTLLVDWLRSDAVGLTGTKLACGEGGCGACTVMLSRWDGAGERIDDTAVNACLRPLVSLDGAMITTTEGIGSTRETLDPVQFRIAAFNGSQCGYCTPGFVMNMFTFLRGNERPTQREIEDLFDGHICRCTGFRPILEGLRSFAVDFEKNDKFRTNHPCCPGIPVEGRLPGARPSLEFPDELKTYRPSSRAWSGRGYTWFEPATLAEAQRLKATHGGSSPDLKARRRQHVHRHLQGARLRPPRADRHRAARRAAQIRARRHGRARRGGGIALERRRRAGPAHRQQAGGDDARVRGLPPAPPRRRQPAGPQHRLHRRQRDDDARPGGDGAALPVGRLPGAGDARSFGGDRVVSVSRREPDLPDHGAPRPRRSSARRDRPLDPPAVLERIGPAPTPSIFAPRTCGGRTCTRTAPRGRPRPRRTARS